MTMKQYIDYCEQQHGLAPRLVRAVIRQHGRGWEGWQASAPQIAQQGISGSDNEQVLAALAAVVAEEAATAYVAWADAEARSQA